MPPASASASTSIKILKSSTGEAKRRRSDNANRIKNQKVGENDILKDNINGEKLSKHKKNKKDQSFKYKELGNQEEYE